MFKHQMPDIKMILRSKHQYHIFEKSQLVNEIKEFENSEEKIKYISYSKDLRYFFILDNKNQLWMDGNKYNLKNVTAIHCGEKHVIISTDSSVYLYGYEFRNNTYRYGFEINTIVDVDNVVIVRLGFNFAIFCTRYGDIFTKGSNEFGQLGLGRKEEYFESFMEIKENIIKDQIVDIQCGHFHTLILTNKGNIYGCGNNYFGQLGIYKPQIFNTFKQINISFKVIQIGCSRYNSLILNEKRELFISGYNAFGELGLDEKFNKRNYFYFTKILNIYPVKRIFSTLGGCNYILTVYNEIYGTGQLFRGHLGVERKVNKFIKLNCLQEFLENYNLDIFSSSERTEYIFTRRILYYFEKEYDLKMLNNLMKQLNTTTQSFIDINIVFGKRDCTNEGPTLKKIKLMIH
ncbi:hypothetical protein ABK040_016429 [Willaertia magna]